MRPQFVPFFMQPSHFWVQLLQLAPPFNVFGRILPSVFRMPVFLTRSCQNLFLFTAACRRAAPCCCCVARRHRFATSSCRSSPCCPLPSSCRPSPPVAVVVPPVIVLPLDVIEPPVVVSLVAVVVVVPRVAVIVSHRRTARRRCCAARCPADHCHRCVAHCHRCAARRLSAPCCRRAACVVVSPVSLVSARSRQMVTGVQKWYYQKKGKEKVVTQGVGTLKGEW